MGLSKITSCEFIYRLIWEGKWVPSAYEKWNFTDVSTIKEVTHFKLVSDTEKLHISLGMMVYFCTKQKSTKELSTKN